MYHDDCCAVEIEAFWVRSTGAFEKCLDCYSNRLVCLTKKAYIFSEKMQKQGIKVPPTRRINISASSSGLHTDLGLHLSRTWVSVAGTPGSQAALQAVFDERKACLDEKWSRFNMFCTCSRTVSVFIV